ncbi:MAG: lysine-sensitive aspartokinase 3 [Bdellovibrionales bacterium]|nr:lysine-sensitive aspartokinase 3 [Bdellovibrionales bacterium]
MKRSFIVSKFGGTSMGDIPAMERSATISIERNSSVVVVSATSGTTDKLIHIAKQASASNAVDCEKLVFEVKERHQAMMNEMPKNHDGLEILNSYFTELDLLVQNISLLKELTPKAHDHILSLGERMSSLIFKSVLQSKLPNKSVVLLDARTVIKTDSNFGKATPLISEIAKQCAQLNTEVVYVTQGFIGSDADGNTTILGRGGSDYSAALMAEGFNATVLEIWTDVAGIATTDPRLCPTAQIIPEISYAEAGEMAQYGAKILHPATIAPAVRKSIPVFVGSTFEKNLPGTWIKANVENRPAVRAITKRSHQALLTISNPNMLNAYGFMGEAFGLFGKHRISVDCVTTSEISIAVTVDQTTLDNQKFMKDLESIGKIDVETGYALISLIGNDLFSRSSLAKNIFSSVDAASIRMMSLGASSFNFNFLIKEEESKACIQKLHLNLIEGK